MFLILDIIYKKSTIGLKNVGIFSGLNIFLSYLLENFLLILKASLNFLPKWITDEIVERLSTIEDVENMWDKLGLSAEKAGDAVDEAAKVILKNIEAINEIKLEIEHLKKIIQSDILMNSKIIASTVLSSSSFLTKDIEFDYVS